MFGLRTRRQMSLPNGSSESRLNKPVNQSRLALNLSPAFADFEVDWLAQVFAGPGGGLWYVTAAQLLPIFTAFPNS